MGKTLLEATVKEAKKCRYPSKFYVYVLEVSWSEGTTTLVYRRYSDFFEFQCGLLEKFPEEAGAKDPSDRIIPFLPGKKLLGRSQVRSVAEKRKDKLNDYCKALVRLPSKLSDDTFVHNFFEVRHDDLQDPSKLEKEKTGKPTSTSPVGEEISGPMVLERYVAIADYEKQKKNECNLTAGQMVEVIDKNTNGWWFVSLDNFNEGWVPATFLDPLYGTEEAEVEVFVRGQEQYVTSSGYHAQNPDEISFERGVIVDVITKGVDGWWKVHYKEKEGLAPAAYLSRYSGPQSTGNNNPAELVGSVRDAVQMASGTRQSWKPSARVDTQEPIYAPTPRKLSVKRKIARRPAPVKPTAPRTTTNSTVTEPEDEPCPVYEVIPEPEEEVYMTLAAFTAPGTGDGLSFSAGCSVTVVTKNASGWWYVEMGDREGWVPSSYLESAKKHESSKTEPPPPKVPAKSSPVPRRELPQSNKKKALHRSTSEETLAKQSQTKPVPGQTSKVNSPLSKPAAFSGSSWMTSSTPHISSHQQQQQKQQHKPTISITPQNIKKTTPTQPGGTRTHTAVGRSRSNFEERQGAGRPHQAPRPQQSLSSLHPPKPHARSHSTGGSSETTPAENQTVSELAKVLQKRQSATSSSSSSPAKPTSPRPIPKSHSSKPSTTSPSVKRLDLTTKQLTTKQLTTKQPPQRPKPYTSTGKRAPPKRPGPPKPSTMTGGKKVPPPRPTTSPGQTRKTSSTSAGYIVMCEYEGGEGQMSLRKGQRVEVLEKNSDGWWYVKVGSREGWAPSSYLEEGVASKPDRPTQKWTKPSPAPRPVPKPRHSTQTDMYRAAASYQVPVYEDSGMELVAGHTYKVMEKQDGWWFVSDGEKDGWAPSSYLDPA